MPRARDSVSKIESSAASSSEGQGAGGDHQPAVAHGRRGHSSMTCHGAGSARRPYSTAGSTPAGAVGHARVRPRAHSSDHRAVGVDPRQRREQDLPPHFAAPSAPLSPPPPTRRPWSPAARRRAHPADRDHRLKLDISDARSRCTMPSRSSAGTRCFRAGAALDDLHPARTGATKLTQRVHDRWPTSSLDRVLCRRGIGRVAFHVAVFLSDRDPRRPVAVAARRVVDDLSLQAAARLLSRPLAAAVLLAALVDGWSPDGARGMAEDLRGPFGARPAPLLRECSANGSAGDLPDHRPVHPPAHLERGPETCRCSGSCCSASARSPWARCCGSRADWARSRTAAPALVSEHHRCLQRRRRPDGRRNHRQPPRNRVPGDTSRRLLTSVLTALLLWVGAVVISGAEAVLLRTESAGGSTWSATTPPTSGGHRQAGALRRDCAVGRVHLSGFRVLDPWRASS